MPPSEDTSCVHALVTTSNSLELAEGHGSKGCGERDFCCLVVLLKAQFQGQFCSIHLSVGWMQELNAPFASLLTVPNWEMLFILEGQGLAERSRWIGVLGSSALQCCHGLGMVFPLKYPDHRAFSPLLQLPLFPCGGLEAHRAKDHRLR